jgi:hypothetical protein
MDMDQVQLDAAYDQSVYAPMVWQIMKRFASSSETARKRDGAPKRFAYGPSSVKGMEGYPAKDPAAGEVLLHRLHQGEIFAQRHRDTGGLARGKS